MSEVIANLDNAGGEISMLDLLIVLARNKRTLIVVPLCIGIIAAVCSWLLPNIYTANVKLMPPQQPGASSAAAVLSQLGGGALGGLAGGALGIKSTGDLYVGILKSRTIADRLIVRFNLKERFKTKTLIETRERLLKRTAIAFGKDGLITLEFDDKDPVFAASVANSYVEELERLMQGLALTEAGQRRQYFERQLKRTKDELANAEVALRRTQEKTGLIELGAQGRAIIEAISALRAQIATREVVLGSMKTFATDRNPDAIRVESEIKELKEQLTKLEKPNGAENNEGDMAIPSGKVPEVGLEYARKLREVKYHEVLFELMAKQYEIARADEARDSGSLQVIDKAVPPDRKSKPKRMLIVFLAALLSLILTGISLFVIESRRQAYRSPEHDLKVMELMSLVKFSRG